MPGKGAHSLKRKYLHTCEKYTIVIKIYNNNNNIIIYNKNILLYLLIQIINLDYCMYYNVLIPQLETTFTIPWRPGRDMI